MAAELGTITTHSARERRAAPGFAGVGAHALAVPLRIYLVSRALVLACALAAVEWLNHDPGRGPWPQLTGPHVAVVQALGRWDAAWYIDVARFGYRPIPRGASTHASRAFFPGYPVVVRLLTRSTGASALVAAVLLAFVFGAAAAVVLWRLVAEIAGVDAARRAVTLFCLSPGAFVLSMGYSEALYVLATGVALLMLVRREWWLAGAATAVAGFTRSNGLALIATCALVAACVYVRERDRRALAAPLVGSLGVLSFFGYLYLHSGDLLQWFHVERDGWGDRVAPLAALVYHARMLPMMSLRSGGLNDLVWFASGAIGVLGLVALVRWRPPLPVLAYGVLAALLALSSYQVGLRPRMLLTAFPILLAVGVVLRGRAFAVVTGVSVVLLIVLSVLSFGTLAVFP